MLARFRNPVGIITKNQLVTRDTDLLVELAAHDAAAVNISVTSLDPKLQRVLEPRASAPRARLDAITRLRKAGIPVGVMVAPIIPGLTDHELPAILHACADAGAQFAGYIVVRLPLAVAPLVRALAGRAFPRSQREGARSDPAFARRRAIERSTFQQPHARRRYFCRTDPCALRCWLQTGRDWPAAPAFVSGISPA